MPKIKANTKPTEQAALRCYAVHGFVYQKQINERGIIMTLQIVVEIAGAIYLASLLTKGIVWLDTPRKRKGA